MKRILVSIKPLSIGDTVAAIPYVDKFRKVNPTKEIYMGMNDWLIPFFTTFAPTPIPAVKLGLASAELTATLFKFLSTKLAA